MKCLHVFTLISTAGFFDGQYKFLVDKGHKITVCSSPADASKFCKDNSVDYIPLEVARRVDIKADMATIKTLCKIIKQGKYDAVFGHTPKGAMVAMIAAWLSRVPVRVYYRHGLIYTTTSGLKRFIFKSVEQMTALFANHIINVSPSLSALAVKDHLNGDKKQTVMGAGTCGGIDAISKFNPALAKKEDIASLKESLGISPNDYVVGFCGRICTDKGIRELINGFKLFQKQNPNVHAKLLLVGPMDARDHLDPSYVEEINSCADIIATGRVTEHIERYYAAMDVFVFPSYREGFGMCVIEASAMEKPILVSRSHGCVDSIRAGVTGQYIDLTPVSIAEGLSDMLDESKRYQLGTQGRQFVLTNFERTNMWPLIGAYYESLRNNN